MSRLSRRAILFAGALMSLPLSAISAGLGKLTVLSNLGEPLKAEIEVVAVEKGERDSLTVRLAAVEAYLQANLPFPNGSWGLKVTLETRPNGTPFVYIRSVNPVSEPFVDVLVDLRWNGGRLLRAYTALLDPPIYTAPETVAPATPATPVEPVAVAPAAEPALNEPSAEALAAPAPEPAPEPAPQTPQIVVAKEPDLAEPAAAAPQPEVTTAEPPAPAQPQPESQASAPTTRTVQRGDTLSKIAGEVKPADVSLQQMLVLLYRTNPDAFAGKNMNRLRTGKILRIPDSTEWGSVTAADADKEVRVQAADWNAWREKIAGSVDTMPAVPESSQSASGSVAPKAEDKPTPSVEAPKEVLKLSKGESADGKPAGAGAAKDRAAALEEELTAGKKAVAEAEDRAAKLEKSIKDMQSAVELKNKEMAAAEEAAKAANAAKAQPAPTEPTAAAMPKPDTPAVSSEQTAEATPGAEPVPAAPAADTATSTTGEPAAAAPEAPAQAAPAEAATKPRKPIRVEEPAPEPSLLAKIMGEPLYLAGGAGVLALLGLGGFMVWRKRKAAAGDEQIEDAEPEDLPPADDAASTDDTVVPASAPTAKSADDHVSEEVDPIAEADVYLAYGRDTQAEQILKEATQNQPQRQEVYAKLLEIYHKRKDAAAFGPIAQALHSVSGGSGDFWPKAARMGYQIDPSNPLYADGAGVGPVDDLTASNSLDSKLDLDLGLGQGEGTTNTDIDLGDLTLNSSNADLDLSALGGSVDSADLDLRTQVLGSAQQVDLSKTMDANERTQQISRNDLTAELSRTQEGKSVAKDALDFDLDMSTITGTVNKSEPTGLDLDVGDLSLTHSMDNKAEPGLGGGTTLPDVDLSNISLELDNPSSNGPNANGSKDEDWHDVQTKFDLAKAYQEMGDKEGAREILREVVAEGDADQKDAAKKVLEALA